MQEQEKILPHFINTDAEISKLNPDESFFIKGVGKDLNANPSTGNGQSTPVGEGSNTALTLTPTRSNKIIPNVLLPKGYNKNIGQFESVTTQELYYFNFNSNGNHGIYVLDGNTGLWQKIIEDSELGFTDNQENYIAQHRVTLRVIYDENRVAVEKILIFTFGYGWQKWINTIAAIKTDGFNANEFPYWTLQPPHFDRRELLEHAVRPPMSLPVIAPLTPDTSAYGNANLIVDQAFKFAFSYVYTDGRETTASPFSLPLIIKSDDYNFQLSLTPQQASITLYAGSPMVEYIRLYIQKNNGDWYLYDTIYKYSNCDAENNVISDYWLRKNQWSSFQYDTIFNTLTYVFGNDRQYQIIDQDDFNRVQTDMPISSVALSDLKDEVLYANNKYGYDNIDCSITSKFSVSAVEGSAANQCPLKTSKITLYAYIDGVGRSQPILKYNNSYIFSGVFLNGTTSYINNFGNGVVQYVSNGNFVCYLKGTPYYAIGELCVSDNLGNITKVDHVLDSANADDMQFIYSVINSEFPDTTVVGGITPDNPSNNDNTRFFIVRFNFVVPSGFYSACLGRHDALIGGEINYTTSSTYVMGLINNSDIFAKTSYYFTNLGFIDSSSKEFYIDCSNGDFDQWNKQVLNVFFIGTPMFDGRWIEGYLYEDISLSTNEGETPIEQYPYIPNSTDIGNGGFGSNRYCGFVTDKNGFYFGFVAIASSFQAQFLIYGNLNCSYQSVNNPIAITNAPPTPSDLYGFFQNINIYLINHLPVGQSAIGSCNRVLLKGTIKSLTGAGLSNVSVSIVDGETSFTDVQGNFTLIVHNGMSAKRVSNVIINGSGRYTLAYDNCGLVSPFQYDENTVPCINCDTRILPFFFNISVQVIGTQTYVSVKQNAQYTTSIIGYDLAGRETFVNEIDNVSIPSFLQRQDTLPMHFEWQLANGLDLRKEQSTRDLAYLSFAVTKNITYEKYIQWVGDDIAFIDAVGNAVTDEGLAAFARIEITSLLNANIQSNFTLDVNYQFVQGDRLRIYDDGTNLLPITPTSLPIDLQIEGTSYNQAAINANVLPPDVNTVLNTSPTISPTYIVVLYDQRLNQLKNKTGFWIEIYTPIKKVEKEIPFFETNFYPIINGTIAKFTGYDANGKPSYVYPTTGEINYWDTYIYGRYINIPLVGDSSFYHNFESPNVSDKWGRDITSGGRVNIINPYAAQIWYPTDTIRSDVFLSYGSKNGLGTFRKINKKSFEGYWRGGIVAVHAMNSVLIAICENDYFTANYSYHYAYANKEGQMVTNLDSGISEPHPKIGMVFGCSYEDTGTIVIFDKFISWLDIKNEAEVVSDYQSATDISDITDDSGRKYGIKSYLIKKIQFINQWNASNPNEKRFDVVSGVDAVRKNIIISFRPRRNNNNNPLSYVSNRRNIDLKNQETIVYNLDSKRWTKFENYVAEGYANLRGNSSGVEFISFAAGMPYIHNQSGNTSFLNFFGVQTEPVIIGVFNKQSDIVKILQSVSLDNVDNNFYVDMVYDNEQNSFSYIPFNMFKQKEKFSYAGVLRNMVSYFAPSEDKKFKSTLIDGKRISGRYMVVRFVGQVDTLNNYFQLNSLNSLITNGHTTKP